MATIDLSGLVRPQLVEATRREDAPNVAEFRLQPLERGFGHGRHQLQEKGGQICPHLPVQLQLFGLRQTAGALLTKKVQGCQHRLR